MSLERYKIKIASWKPVCLKKIAFLHARMYLVYFRSCSNMLNIFIPVFRIKWEWKQNFPEGKTIYLTSDQNVINRLRNDPLETHLGHYLFISMITYLTHCERSFNMTQTWHFSIETFWDVPFCKTFSVSNSCYRELSVFKRQEQEMEFSIVSRIANGRQYRKIQCLKSFFFCTLIRNTRN